MRFGSWDLQGLVAVGGVAEIWRESESLEERFLELTADSKPGDMGRVGGDDRAGS